MILTGHAIRHAVEQGRIKIEPFNEEQLNPASYDLTLDDRVLIYKLDYVHDVSVAPVTQELRISEEGFVISPDQGYLMATRERITHDHHVGVVDGKSSLGRLFISVHQTAGYGDPGFSGNYTLEVTTIYPIRLYAGMRIAQIRFHEVTGAVMRYAGNYTGESASGPVASKAWKQFKREGDTDKDLYARLKKLALTMPIGPISEKDRFDWSYGNLASSTRHKPSREAFADLAKERGWSMLEFEKWADGKEWAKP